MKRTALILLGALWTTTFISAPAAPPALTIYNQDFAVVREVVALDLKAGVTTVKFAGATAYVEPASVILRDPTGKHLLQVLEQNFRANTVSQDLLLSLNEGKTIEFENVGQEGSAVRREIVRGKVIRGGYDARLAAAGAYGYGWGANLAQPIIEVNGKLRFSLPGQPIFPSLADDTILKPTLSWLLESDRQAKFEAELSYITGGLRWDADYNLVLPEQGDVLDLVGWVTMENQSGKNFEQARIKLMAGDVNKIQSVGGYRRVNPWSGGGMGGGGMAPPVTEKAFDEYHLYALEHPATLRDHESKQVEFVRAAGVVSTARYVYDGARAGPAVAYPETVNTDPDYGVQCSTKVTLLREVTNSAANHLGLPLPKGKARFYRRNADGQSEFIGENVIDHTPRDEILRLPLGDAFDLVGERKRTDFRVNLVNPAPGAVDPGTGLPVVSSGPATNTAGGPWLDEAFAITLRNHKREAVVVRVVEHLYRWINWDITRQSHPCRKTDSQTIEFAVRVEPNGEQKVDYLVHYSW